MKHDSCVPLGSSVKDGFSKHNWSGTVRAESNDRAFSKLELARYVPTGDL